MRCISAILERIGGETSASVTRLSEGIQVATNILDGGLSAEFSPVCGVSLASRLYAADMALAPSDAAYFTVSSGHE